MGVTIKNGAGGQSISMSAQDLLNAANQLLYTISEDALSSGCYPVVSAGVLQLTSARVRAAMIPTSISICGLHNLRLVTKPLIRLDSVRKAMQAPKTRLGMSCLDSGITFGTAMGTMSGCIDHEQRP